MTPASQALGRRLRLGYCTVLIIVGGGMVAAGWQITRVLGSTAQHQRMIGIAGRQSSVSLRAADFSDGIKFDPSNRSAQDFEQAIANWQDDQASIEAFLAPLCAENDVLCDRFKVLQSKHQALEKLLRFHVASRLVARTDSERTRDAAFDAYSEEFDQWAADLAVRLSDATVVQQKALFSWTLLLAAFTGLVIVVVLEPTIRTLQTERSVSDRWTLERQKLATLAERTHHSMFIIEPTGRVEWANDAFLRMAGVTLAQAAGLLITDILKEPLITPDTQARIQASLAQGESFQFDLVYRPSVDDVHFASIDCRPVIENGGITSYFAIESDITDRKRNEETIAKQRTMLAATSEMAGVGGWQHDLESGKRSWSDTLFKIHELPVGPVPPMRELLECFTPSDREVVLTSVRAASAEGKSSTYELPFVTARGNHRWVRTVITPQIIDGRLVGIAGAVQDVTAVREAAEQLQSAKQAADAASTAKGLFLANISHEIRTPLNGVIGMTALLLDTPLNSQQREYADIARSSGQSLLALINDVLDLSKIESGRLDLEHIEFDLRTVIYESMDAVAFSANEKRLELSAEVDPTTPVTVRGDPTRLRQVLLNLMSNAVKFTGTGDVTLTVGHAPAAQEGQGGQPAFALTFSIADSGIGISAEGLQKLFTPFTQADASTTRRYGGTGLGLSICRRLVNAMGGEIEASSTVGRGSTFNFSVLVGCVAQAEIAPPARLAGRRALVIADHPTTLRIISTLMMSWRLHVSSATSAAEGLACWKDLTAVDQAPDFVVLDYRLMTEDDFALTEAIRSLDPLRHSRILLLSSLTQHFTAEERATFDDVLTKPLRGDSLLVALLGDDAPTAASMGSNTQLAGIRVLLVDDNLVNQKVGERLLERLGAQVLLASNGVEALASLRFTPFDVVFMDCQMPEMDGYEATRQLRNPDSGVIDPNIPVIALTANALSGDRDRCLAAGMTDYITKPLSAQQLTNVLNAVQKRMRIQRQGLGSVLDDVVQIAQAVGEK